MSADFEFPKSVVDPEEEGRWLEYEAKAQEIRLRERFARWARITVTVWLAFIGAFLIAAGAINFFFDKIPYSDAVLITLLGTTTANVIALTVLIIKGLFPGRTK